MHEKIVPKTAREARELGVGFYVNGKPCPKGHINPRRSSRYYNCEECNIARQRKYYARKGLACEEVT